jgi:hypothetical protein
MMSSVAVLESLSRARAIAHYAEGLGISQSSMPRRPSASHIGAVLADGVLQSGLNYQTVIRPRVERIRAIYPDAATLSGVMDVLQRGGASEFLSWQHSTKITRFVRLVDFLGADHVEYVGDLRSWLSIRGARNRLLELHGIGPKTYDYLCCLVGMDHIAVDRHIKTFATEAGVRTNGYEELQEAVSFAADLLGLARRDFDAWIWQRLSQPVSIPLQYALL